MDAVDVRGRFVWHQLMTRDVPGAKQFYCKLAGWKALPWPLDPAYTVCHADVGPVAGMMAMPSDLPAEVPSHWLQYIGTRDVDRTTEAAVRAGGSMVKEPAAMQGAGRYAVLKDPQGAVFAVIDPENAKPEPPGVPPLGTFSWHELATTDNEAAFAFYNALFGWEVLQRMDMGPAGIYLIFGQDGNQRGGMYIPPPDKPGPPSWLPYARIADTDQCFASALAAGAREMFAPMEVPGGSRVAAFIDPGGAAFAIHATPAGASAPAVETAKPEATARRPARAAPRRKPAARKTAPRKAAAKRRPAKKKSRKPAGRAKVTSRATKRAARKPARKAARGAPKKKSAAKNKTKARRKK